MKLSRVAALLMVANSRASIHSSRWLLISGGGANTDTTETPPLDFIKLSERVVWKGKYRQIKQAEWRFPNGKNVTFDILTQGGEAVKSSKGSVTVFCFNRKDRTATLVREFHPGAECLQLGTCNGMYEADKHSSPLECAQMELEEEAQLRCADENWIPLCDPTFRGICMDKYSDNFLRPFLALDAEPVVDGRPPDDEEFISAERGLKYDEVMRLVRSGGINVASSHCVLLAYRKLDDMDIPYR